MTEDNDVIAELVKALVKALVGSLTAGGASYLMGWYTILGLQVLPDPLPWAIAALSGCALAFTIRPKTLKARTTAFRWSIALFLVALILYVAYKEADYFIPWLAILDLVVTAGLFSSLTLLLGLGPGEYEHWKKSHQ